MIEVAFTDVALSLGDAADPEVREAALRQVAAETGAAQVLMHQVHGADTVVVPDPDVSAPSCDALITRRTDVALLSRAADCVPVLLADPETGWIGAVHSGRPGLAAGVLPAALDQLRTQGASPTTAWIGPYVCGACYEVPEEMRAEVAAVVPEAASTTSWGTPALDLGAGIRAQLRDAGITDVREVGACTREDPTWPSYRRDGAAATRFAGVIWSHHD